VSKFENFLPAQLAVNLRMTSLGNTVVNVTTWRGR